MKATFKERFDQSAQSPGDSIRVEHILLKVAFLVIIALSGWIWTIEQKIVEMDSKIIDLRHSQTVWRKALVGGSIKAFDRLDALEAYVNAEKAKAKKQYSKIEWYN